MKQLKIIVISSFFMFLLLSLTGCAKYSEPITKTEFILDTNVSITVYNEKDALLIDDAFELCKEYETLLNKNNDSSDIKKLENNRFRYIEVSDATIDIINLYYELYEISEYKLDCTIGAVSSLWDFKKKEKIPQEIDLQEAVDTVQLKNVLVKDNKVNLSNTLAEIDFGAIAKGYISGKVRNFLENEGVANALLNFGGNIVVIGNKPDGKHFNIGIQKPFEENEVIASVSVNDTSVVTAGIYERYIEHEGKIYHHILDVNTGYPVETNLNSATIIYDDPAKADAYSTICILLGKEKALEIINNTENMEAILITNDNEIIYSDNAEKYVNKE